MLSNITKALHILFLAIFFWTFEIATPYLETKAYAETTLPLQTDLSEPDPVMKVEYRRIKGRDDAVFLNIPSNMITNTQILPADPAPVILAKYNDSTATGTLAVMRIRQVGGNIQAGIFRITPTNFQHHFGPHLYHFAWLDFDKGCNWAEKYLHDQDPPQINRELILKRYNEYDLKSDYGRNLAVVDPTPFLKTYISSEQTKINRSNSYWHQRLNNDPCFTHRGLKDFVGNGDGNFNNISHYGFLKLVALAMQIHNASNAIIATPKIRQTVSKKTRKSAFRKKVTVTVRYYLKPEYTVATWKAFNNMYFDYEINPSFTPNGTIGFVKVQGEHTFPVDETLIYQWSKTQSGWTGLFVFVASVGLGLLGGALAAPLFTSFSTLTTTLAGGAVGAIGGLVASGFNPTTSVTAHLTPFFYSAYQLDPSINMSGDAKKVADNTRLRWIMPDPQATPGGVQKFVMSIDYRKIAKAGSNTTMDTVENDTSPAITVISEDDPRFQGVFNEMFKKPYEELKKHKYPYSPRDSISMPVPIQ